MNEVRKPCALFALTGTATVGRGLLCGFVVLSVFCLLPASDTRVQLQRYEYSADAMGGAFSVTLYSPSRAHANAASEAAFIELRRLDHLFSNYRPDSELSELNRRAATQPVRVSQELFDLISASVEYSRQSEGAFDITVGPLVKAWNFYEGPGRLADSASVQQALDFVGYRKIRLDEANRTIRFTRAGVEMDPGGIGKGYAVDRMIGVLKKHGVERALVSAAGSSIYALGSPADRDGWPVEIRNPKKPSSESERLLLKDESLSTSGSTRKFFRADGRIYGHILDPRTGYPVQEVLLVAVVAPRTIDSEVWTKAFFVNGRRWSIRHIPAGFRVFFCEEAAGLPRCSWLP